MNRKARILFVDDEKRVLNSMRGLFRRDYELFLTTEGQSAVEIARENSLDVVVADQRMPGMNGTEVLGKIKQLSPRTVRILLTGYADPEAVEGSINIGEVFRFLSKPCPPQLLRDTLKLAVAAARANRSEPSAMHLASSTRAPTPAGVPEITSPPGVRPPSARPPLARGTAPIAAAGRTQGQNHGAQSPPAVTPPAGSSSHWQSVTEIVLSGDSTQEIRQLTQAAGTSRLPGVLRDIGVVFFTIDSDLAEMAIRAVSEDREAVLVTTLARVVEALEEKNIGVLVTDFSGNNAILQKMISALKTRLPELVTVVISSNRDTTDMIDMINYSRVFRYLLKPVEPAALRLTINAAAAHHHYLRNNPELAKRQEAVNKAAETEGSETLNQFFRRVRDMRSRGHGPADS